MRRFGVSLLRNGPLQLLLCGRQHQLDTIQLINLTGTSIAVYCQNICFFIVTSQIMYYTLAGNMIWQEAEGGYSRRNTGKVSSAGKQ